MSSRREFITLPRRRGGRVAARGARSSRPAMPLTDREDRIERLVRAGRDIDAINRERRARHEIARAGPRTLTPGIMGALGVRR